MSKCNWSPCRGENGCHACPDDWACNWRKATQENITSMKSDIRLFTAALKRGRKVEVES